MLDPGLIRQHLPDLSRPGVPARTAAVLLARRCGWFSGQQLGMYLLERAWEHGMQIIQARLEGVMVQGGQVAGVEIEQDGARRRVSCRVFINAAGPYLRRVGSLLGQDLPTFASCISKYFSRTVWGACAGMRRC